MKNGDATPFLTDEQKQLLRKSAMCSRLTDDQASYFFEIVSRTRLDPFIGQIRPDLRKNKNHPDEPSLLIITTLQGLRVIGDRSGKLDGESKVEWCGANGEWFDVWTLPDPPFAARASVYRTDRSHAYTTVCRWDGFVQLVWDKGGKLVPGPFWERMGPHMLGKCTLAAGYRAAFPDPCSGLYINEELQGEIDKDSEEAIEAEMVRRAQVDKEYWDAQREKGIISINEQQEKEKVAAAEYISNRPQIAPVPAPMGIEPPAKQAKTTNGSIPPTTDWRDFVITRFATFKGRRVDSLTSAELQGMGPVMSKLQESWASIDEDFKAHYNAIKARIEEDQKQELDALAGSLEFGTVER